VHCAPKVRVPMTRRIAPIQTHQRRCERNHIPPMRTGEALLHVRRCEEDCRNGAAMIHRHNWRQIAFLPGEIRSCCDVERPMTTHFADTRAVCELVARRLCLDNRNVMFLFLKKNQLKYRFFHIIMIVTCFEPGFTINRSPSNCGK
jgi:hypothetical protein